MKMNIFMTIHNFLRFSERKKAAAEMKIDNIFFRRKPLHTTKQKAIWEEQKAILLPLFGEAGKNYHSADCGCAQLVLSQVV